MKKSFAGGAVPTTLAVSIDEVNLSLTGTNFQGWPDGTSGPFNVTLGRDTASEEKCLATSISGTTLTLSQRGYDGTLARAHSASTTIEHGWFGIDATEANTHVNSVDGVHGLGVTDGTVVGTTSDDTLTNKKMSGLANQFTDIQPSSIPLTTAEIAGLHNEDVNLQGQINTNKQAQIDGDAAVTAAFTADDAAHVAATDPHAQYLTQTEADARYDALNAASTGDAAHVAASDPHAQYLTQPEGDARYALKTDPLPAPQTVAQNVTQVVTSTTFAALPAPVKVTITFAHDCWVRVSYAAWLAIVDTATGAELRAGCRFDALNPPQVAWGEVLEIANTATQLSSGQQQRYGSVLKKVLAGTRSFEVVAYRTAATNTANVNYAFIEVLPIAWG